jgi:hypothetical protein
MNKPVKARIRKWVKALRSGEYRQCTNQLRYGQRYCCLGVACMVAIENGVELTRKGNRFLSEGSKGKTLSDGKILPEIVRKWLGLEGHDPQVSSGRRLTGMNDNGDSFETIADSIEATWL